MKIKSVITTIIITAAAFSFADEVRTSDGFVLKGKISAINNESLTIETDRFGSLTVPRTDVSAMTMDAPASVRLNDESVVVGSVKAENADAINIAGEHSDVTVAMPQIQELWPEGAEDPRVAAEREKLEAQKHKWTGELTASADGKEGNSKEKNLSMSGEAVLTGPTDELKFYGRLSRKETNREKTADERIIGMQYSSFFWDPLGWYTRAEFENDKFEDLRLRTTFAAGLTYRWANEDHYRLSGRSGLAYRHESYYADKKDVGSIGLDFGLSHYYRYKNFWEIRNELTFTPSVEEFADYLLTQDSHVTMPLAGTEIWNVRVGLRNEYNNQPVPGREHLDTTWYAAAVLRKR